MNSNLAESNKVLKKRKLKDQKEAQNLGGKNNKDNDMDMNVQEAETSVDSKQRKIFKAKKRDDI